MKATQKLCTLGQSLWLDHINRDLLNSGTFKRYIEEMSVTGLTLRPRHFNSSIKGSSAYDAAILKKLKEGKLGEELIYELMLEDLSHAADLLRPSYDQTDGVDGWVSLELSPILTDNTECILAAVKDLHTRVRRPNFFIKIPGTKEGLPAMEEAIFAGIPINVTLLFSCEHYLAAAEAFLRGIERRIADGLRPNVGSVASISVRHWDDAVRGRVPDALRNKLGVAVARRTYKACCDLMNSLRWQRAYNAGARPQRLLWAGAETPVRGTPDDFYIKNLTAPSTIISLSECALNALADDDEIGTVLPADGGSCESVLDSFEAAGIDIDTLGAELQDREAASDVTIWIELMSEVASKSAALWQLQ